MSAKLLLVGIDGLRWDVASADGVAPTLMRLAAEGSVTPMWMVPPTDSGPGWSTILTGFGHEDTNVYDNEFVNHQLGSCPDLLSRVWMRDRLATTYAAVTWRQLVDPRGRGPVIHTRIDQQRGGLHTILQADGEALGCAVADEQVQAEAARRIVAHAPDASFVYFEGVDDAGHTHGSVGPEYREAIGRVDELLRCLWKAVEERVRVHGEDWILAVTTDHGHKDEGGHGEDEEQVRRSFLVLNRPLAGSGSGPVPSFEGDLEPTDVVPILLDLTA